MLQKPDGKCDEKWLVLGVGTKNDFERWNKFINNSWDCINLQSEIPNCKQIDFNDITQLRTLQNNYYDIIVFDWSTVKFTSWTHSHLFEFFNKLKLGGKFYISRETSGFLTYDNKKLVTIYLSKLYDYLINKYNEKTLDGSFLNGRNIESVLPCIIYDSALNIPYFWGSLQFKTTFQDIHDEVMLNRIIPYNIKLLKSIFGSAEYREDDNYLIPPDANRKINKYYLIIKTKEIIFSQLIETNLNELDQNERDQITSQWPLTRLRLGKNIKDYLVL